MRLALLALGVSLGAVILARGILLRIVQWLNRDAVDGTLTITPPVVKFAGFDPGVRERTTQRRQAADQMRTRAAHVETGAPVADVLRNIRRA